MTVETRPAAQGLPYQGLIGSSARALGESSSLSLGQAQGGDDFSSCSPDRNGLVPVH